MVNTYSVIKFKSQLRLFVRNGDQILHVYNIAITSDQLKNIESLGEKTLAVIKADASGKWISSGMSGMLRLSRNFFSAVDSSPELACNYLDSLLTVYNSKNSSLFGSISEQEYKVIEAGLILALSSSVVSDESSSAATTSGSTLTQSAASTSTSTSSSSTATGFISTAALFNASEESTGLCAPTRSMNNQIR